jgi:N-acetylmuramoyl-L-alanine amidase
MVAEALVCLALNAYHEARNQDVRGMIAVSQVVMNRVESDYFPDDVCEVVYQGPHRPSWARPEVMIPIKNRCQFSWYCDGKDDEPHDKESWEMANLVAHGVINNSVDDPSDGALWYHADYVEPEWASEKREIATIGNHIFYGIKGNATF